MPPNQDIFSPVSTWLLPAFALAILLCRQSAFSPQAHDDAQESIRPHSHSPHSESCLILFSIPDTGCQRLRATLMHIIFKSLYL
ncbi:MAG: hypothetical protein K6T68_07145, partial [Alicyclobacillus shizuokensis]|nr:hypothetical protein [Alicyclobacillus shizuokensis]